jgi:hypothetical protein
MNKVSRATKVLERVKARTGMSEDGMRWLTETLDPMHDEKLHVVGYPDRTVAPSIVQMVKQSADISSPYDPSLIWGFHLMIDDQVLTTGNNQYSVTSGSNQVNIDTTVSPTLLFPVGGMNVVAFLGTSTTPTWRVDVTETNPHQIIKILQLDPSYLIGKTRILSVGVEICNTTAELYKGGAVLAYEAPDAKAEQSTFIVNFADTEALFSDIQKYGAENIFVEDPQFEKIEKDVEIKPRTVLDELSNKDRVKVSPEYEIRISKKKYYVLEKGNKRYLDLATVPYLGSRSYSYKNTPPNGVADAMLLPGTQQWGAAEGAYMVQTMSDMDNPPSFLDTRGSLWTTDEAHCPTAASANAGFIVFTDPPNTKQLVSSTQVTNTCGFATAKTIPFHRKGLIFTGLTGQSTFKVTIMYL